MFDKKRDRQRDKVMKTERKVNVMFDREIEIQKKTK